MQNALMESPGDRLKKIRIEAGYLKAADAARAIGVPYPTYAGHENASRGLGRAFRRYADFYRVSLTWLLTGKGEARPKDINARLLSLSPEGQRLAREMFELIEQRDGRPK